MKDRTCGICNHSNCSREYTVKEMMLNLRHTFTYFECSYCGCLQIAGIPADMSRYYPSNYYSFYPPERSLQALSPIEKNFLGILTGISKSSGDDENIGKSLFFKFPDEVLRSLADVRLTKKTKILDVGCGAGVHLYILKNMGLQNLLGIDLYIEADIEYENGLTILKRSLDNLEVSEEWDLVMLHHSFEHMAKPQETLNYCRKLLTPDGECLIRMPTVPSYAWSHYGVNWVQIDAPRHFFIHSVKSLELLAAQAGLELDKVIYDSSSFQFWGSELYLKDIPQCAGGRENFTPEQHKLFAQKAQELNEQKKGDQAAFYLKKRKEKESRE